MSNQNCNNSHIAISGDLGSGKSLISKKICELLGYERISVGDIQRKLSEEHGMSTTEFNKYMEQHPEIDQEFDRKIETLGLGNEGLVFDSRMAWFFVPSAFKIHLIVNLDVAAQRILDDQARIGESYSSIEETKENIITRKKSENSRFRTKYSVECDNFDNYNLIIDTSYSTPQEILDVVFKCLEKFQTKCSFDNFWISPRRLYPIQDIRTISKENLVRTYKDFEISIFEKMAPIKVLECNSYYFIYDGHKRTSVCLSNKIPLVPIRIIDGNNDIISGNISPCEYARTNFRLCSVYDWEDAHNFKFNAYPFNNEFSVV